VKRWPTIIGRTLPNARELALWGENAFRPALPIAGREQETALPDARRGCETGAPRRNKNALKSGLYTREALDERQALANSFPRRRR
jgi:hypothetical protein